MPSPFPGIDPFLESHDLWPDFHARFISSLADAIADRLPEPYVARIDERMSLVEIPAEEIKKVRPDVAVTRQRDVRASETTVAPFNSDTLTLDPEIIPFKYLEEYREVSMEILHGPDQRLVTVVEVLSPTNKTGAGRRDYLAKRNGLMRLGDVHLVELDLLVAGRRLPMERPPRRGDYHAYVARTERQPDCEVYTWTVRQAPPRIPIPLLARDPDVLIDLAPLFNAVFDRARYVRSIRYDGPLTTPFASEDHDWAEALARSFQDRDEKIAQT